MSTRKSVAKKVGVDRARWTARVAAAVLEERFARSFEDSVRKLYSPALQSR